MMNTMNTMSAMKIFLRSKRLRLLVALLCLSLLSLGNGGCKDKKVLHKKSGYLKKRVYVKNFEAESVHFGSRNFDISSAVMRQTMDLLHKSKHYVVVGEKLNVRDQAFYRRWSGKTDLPYHEHACLLGYPQVYVHGSLISFEMISRSGVRLSLKKDGPLDLTDMGAKFQMERAQLDLVIWASSPLTEDVLSTGYGSEEENKYNFELDIFSLLGVGFEYFQKTPIAKVTRGALTSAINEMNQELEKDQEWQSRVILDNDDYILIQGGTMSGLKKGDQLAIFNEDRTVAGWTGEPCASEYYGLPSTEPIAVIELERLGSDISEGFVVERTGDDNAHIGAIVKWLGPLSQEDGRENIR